MTNITAPCLYIGRRTHVLGVQTIESSVDLGFGVSIRRQFSLEGRAESYIQQKHKDLLKHAMVVLLGGKRVFIKTDGKDNKQKHTARVFLYDEVYSDEAFILPVYGMDIKRLEVTAFLEWLAQSDYSVNKVKEVVNNR